MAAFKTSDAGVSIDIFRRFGEESLDRLKKELDSEQIRAETVLCEGTDPTNEILQGGPGKYHRSAGDRHARPQRPGQAGSWIDSGRADSPSQMSNSHHRTRGAAAEAADKLSENRLRDGFLSGGGKGMRVCLIVCPGLRRPSLLMSCAASPEGTGQMNDQELNDRVCERVAETGSRRGPRMVRTRMCSRAWVCGGRHSVARPAGESRSHCAGDAQNVTLVRQFQNRRGVPGDQRQHLPGAYDPGVAQDATD